MSDSPAAVPDVTALAQQMLDTLRVMEARDFLALDRDGQRSLIEILAALLALVEQLQRQADCDCVPCVVSSFGCPKCGRRAVKSQEWLLDVVAQLERTLRERDEAREEIRIREESQIPVIPRGAQAKMERLEAELEQSRQACNICEEPWPHHAEACSYPANVRRMQTAERERDEARRESDWQMGSKLDAQRTLMVIVEALDLRLADLGNGWLEAAPKILARIETIVDEADRAFRERDEAQAALREIEHWDNGWAAGIARAALVVAGRPPTDRKEET